MATDAFLFESGVAPNAAVMVPGRETAAWLLARVGDGHEAVVSVEVDASWWRLRRANGAMASMLEVRVSGAMGAGDVAAAIVRWAHGVGLTARASVHEGCVSVTLARLAD